MQNHLFAISRSFLITGALMVPCLSAQTSEPAAAAEHQASNILNNALTAKNPTTRKHAVQALGLVSSQEPFAARLEVMLRDKDVAVREAAVESLRSAPSSRAVPALTKALDDAAPEVSFAAAQALFSLHEPAGREFLVSVLGGDTKTASGIVAKRKQEAARMLHDPKALSIFAFNQGTWFAPVPYLGKGVSTVERSLAESAATGRAVTALLLADDQDPKIALALQEALSAKNPSVRVAALKAIALRNDSSQRKNIIPMFEDKKEAVRIQAAACFQRLQAANESHQPVSFAGE